MRSITGGCSACALFCSLHWESRTKNVIFQSCRHYKCVNYFRRWEIKTVISFSWTLQLVFHASEIVVTREGNFLVLIRKRQLGESNKLLPSIAPILVVHPSNVRLTFLQLTTDGGTILQQRCYESSSSDITFVADYWRHWRCWLGVALYYYLALAVIVSSATSKLPS